MLKRNLLPVAGLVAIAALISAVSTNAVTLGSNGHINHVTFNQPVRLPGVLLPAGTYEFELGPAGTHRDLVRVSSRLGRPYYLGFTREVPRPGGWPNTRVLQLTETAPGAPPAIATWYPVDSSSGHAFVYP